MLWRQKRRSVLYSDIAEKDDVYMEHDSSQNDTDETDVNQTVKKTV